MEDVWERVMGLAWEAYRAGGVPVGAVVLDSAGRMVTQARGRRHDPAPVARQLTGSRIAHAEVNALGLLPIQGRYEDHVLYVNVEPCCLCLGAIYQTGVGRLIYGWRDRYGGATTTMTVDNPQVARRRLRIVGPAGGYVEALTGLLVASHYLSRRPGLDHVTAPLVDAEPRMFALAADPAVACAIRDAGLHDRNVDDLLTALELTR